MSELTVEAQRVRRLLLRQESRNYSMKRPIPTVERSLSRLGVTARAIFPPGWSERGRPDHTLPVRIAARRHLRLLES